MNDYELQLERVRTLEAATDALGALIDSYGDASAPGDVWDCYNVIENRLTHAEHALHTIRRMVAA